MPDSPLGIEDSQKSSAFLAVSEAPFAPPGNIKGVALLTAVRALRACRNEALAKLPPDLHHYLLDEILTTAWYPEQHFFKLLEVVAELRAKPGHDVWQWMGQRTAEMDLTGIFASMVQPGRPLVTISRLPRLWHLYRSAGELNVTLDGEHRATIEMQDYAPLNDFMLRLFSAYFAEAVHLAGGENALVRISDRGENGATFHLTWT
jgi:uncharacterized protein (TIGR02265 family)